MKKFDKKYHCRFYYIINTYNAYTLLHIMQRDSSNNRLERIDISQLTNFARSSSNDSVGRVAFGSNSHVGKSSKDSSNLSDSVGSGNSADLADSDNSVYSVNELDFSNSNKSSRVNNRTNAVGSTDSIPINSNSTSTPCTSTMNIANANIDWNNATLLLLGKIGKKTMGYRWMHEQEALYCDKMNKRVNLYDMFVLTLIGIATSTGFINFVSDTGLNNNRTFFTVIFVIQLTIVFFEAIIKGFKNIQEYEKRYNAHTNAAIKNAELNLSIQYQLTLDISERDNPKIFLKNVIKNFNDILLLSPPIRIVIKEQYLKAADDNDMFNPITANDIFNPLTTNNNNQNLQVIVRDNLTTNNVQNNANNDSLNNNKIKYEIDRWLQCF